MYTGWRYRLGAIAGAVVLSALAVAVANHPVSQQLFTTYVPLFWRLDPVVLSGQELYFAMLLSMAIFAGALWPLYKPQPRRLLDTISLASKRVIAAGCLLATLGFFNYSYRLPRATLAMGAGILVIVLPAWFVLLQWSPNGDTERALIVGDDPDAMEAVLAAAPFPVLGYVSPPAQRPQTATTPQLAVTDGGPTTATDAATTESLSELACLGGLSRLETALVEYDVDTVVLAFSKPDRAEFFGTLDTCYEHGVTAKVHRQHADSVLTTGFGSDDLVDVDLEPWDAFDHLLKRGFDITFAGVGLLFAAPLMSCLAVAIKLDDGGPILYSQQRTATFGDTFPVYKFRTMVENTEDADPVDDDENPHITRVGGFLRQTHLDEIPQLWSILIGDMSVVGPRAVWVDEETKLEDTVGDWRKRWFVKPGLTGLAQINDATSTAPKAKLRYDMEYIRRQSFWFDIKIVIRQVWQVLRDLIGAIR